MYKKEELNVFWNHTIDSLLNCCVCIQCIPVGNYEICCMSIELGFNNLIIQCVCPCSLVKGPFHRWKIKWFRINFIDPQEFCGFNTLWHLVVWKINQKNQSKYNDMIFKNPQDANLQNRFLIFFLFK